ncbi:snaclec coagulation factor IX/factor X-binding protein subunit B-like [Ptychodera flava]|uniref:snaclec coagulation factor IX/factor X-binding protein subunit B-like n=1 Tax=Ptychodera flava TaxID=63121 RepID=UPI00396A9179
MVKEKLDWTSANFACARFRGKLATILSRQTQLFLRRQVLLTGSTKDWWFGFQFHNDSSVGNNSLFASGEVTDGQCSKMTRKYNYLWTTDDCQAENHFICEEDINKEHGCSYGWSFHGGHCYRYVNTTPMDFEKSRQQCMSAGAHLVTISNLTENQFVTSLINETCPSCAVFIGYNDIGTEGIFTWDSGFDGEYKNWSPSNVFSDTKDCVVLDSSDGTWRETSCSQPNGFMCEMTAFSPN